MTNNLQFYFIRFLIVFFIYFELIKFSKKGLPQDTFIMSKGHGCMSQYVILEKLNILKKKRFR